MAKKKAAGRRMGGNPLDRIVPQQEKGEPPSRPKERRRTTFHLSVDLVERARNAVYALSGPPVRMTLAQLAEDGLTKAVEALEKKHNGGAPFPQRDADLRGSRVQ